MPAATPHYRPAWHFTPAAHWMNDPNGLVFDRGTYHLFFQYHPKGITWGPMHWGHASSTDLLHWQEHAVALAPDALGMIFSGSIVIDERNTSGLGRDGQAPWIAVFTHHRDAATAGQQAIESQSLAFSLDHGQTWTKYAGNPVLPSPGPRDFRDPKVFWHEPTARWIMSLAVGDHIAFHASPDLKAWAPLSTFGQGIGARGGVWECPDLFPLELHGQTRWVLFVSVNPGGPNGGSATQYFVGDFDGRNFIPESTATRWLDHGPDSYAGVTWSGTGERRNFIAWMSNWDYGSLLPTAPWRSAMTLPRDLVLRDVGGTAHVTSMPAAELLRSGWIGSHVKAAPAGGHSDLSDFLHLSSGRFVLQFVTARLRRFELTLGNEAGDELIVGFDASTAAWFIDRRRAGAVDFSPRFAGRHTAPRLADGAAADVMLFFDATSVELFADGGLTVMTSLFFPRRPFTRLQLTAANDMPVDGLVIRHRVA